MSTLATLSYQFQGLLAIVKEIITIIVWYAGVTLAVLNLC